MCHWAGMRDFDALSIGASHYFKSSKKMRRWLRRRKRTRHSPWGWSLYKKDHGEWVYFKFIFLNNKEDEKWLKRNTHH